MTAKAVPAAASMSYPPGWFSRALERGLESPRRVAPLLVELVRPSSHERFGGELLDLVHPVRHARLAHYSALRACKGAVEWPNARPPRAARVLSPLRSRGR
jgi:hypothetical protein